MRIIYVLICFVFMISCTSEYKKTKTEKEFTAELKKPLIKANKKVVIEDELKIKKYFNRRGWDMKMDSSGLWYDIYSSSEDSLKVEKGDYISILYTLSLLNGKLCYSSDSLGLKTFNAGRGIVELGLDKAVLMMKKGDKAHIIAAPHLAFGLLGDDNRIPRRATVVYNIEIKDIIKK